MIDYSNEIRKRIQMCAVETPVTTLPAKTLPVVKKKDDVSFLTYFIGAALTILVMVLLTMPVWKNSVLNIQRPQQQVNIPPANPKPIVGYVPVSDYNKDMVAVNAKIDGLDKVVRTIGLRSWVSSLAQNENINVYQKLHPQEKGYITLDDEWRLSKIPETMQLTQDQKEQLKNWIVK